MAGNDAGIEQAEIALEDHLTEAEDAVEVQVSPFSVSSYGADYPVETLVSRIKKGDIYVPEFQRGFVWDIKDASRFIESLVLGLPVPGIFLTKELETGKLLVVDGQQRLFSLHYFYEGKWPSQAKEFALKSVQPGLEGRTYATLRPEDRRRLDDAILHATVFKEDEPSEDERGIYE
ncbi:MAG TPA: DUF262 domain-containing protein, partial [Terriglobales bacterium]|nr:DUF262 domain-containing protein [Terriglobales bacterium]